MRLATKPLSIASLCVGLFVAAVHSTRADDLLEPPMSFPEGGVGDAATNQGHALSADGRFVVFSSFATNLVAGDTNGARDIFLWDSQLNTVQLVSRSSGGTLANGDSSDAVISADGQWIAFSSAASNLTEDANGAVEDVFLYSRAAATLDLVSRSTGGVQSQTAAVRPDINANGRYVTFDTRGDLATGAGTTHSQVFRRDTWSDRTDLVSKNFIGAGANDLSMDAQMSADGERIVFVSMARNLTTAGTVGNDSYLKDMTTGSLQLLSQNAEGEAGDGISYFPTISGDGRFAAFHTNASNLVEGGNANFAGVVLRDTFTGELELLSPGTNGEPANNFSIHPSLSYDADRAVFATNASNLVEGDAAEHVDVVLFDRAGTALSLLSQGPGASSANGDSAAPSISLDGRSVTFETRASNLSPNGTAFSDVVLDRDAADAAAGVPVLAAVLPSSRSVMLGETLTAFATVLGTGIANDCRVQLNEDFSMLASLSFQATNPVNNVVVGVQDQSFLLLPGVPQTLLLTLTPSSAISAEEMLFDFVCSEGAAPVSTGTNTLLVSAEVEAPADVVALAATLANDGVVALPVGGGAGFFSVASVNLGTSTELNVRPVVLGAPLDGISICQTNPVTSVCLQEASAWVSTNVEAGETPTFAVFVSHSTDVEFAPGENRIVVQFEDNSGIVRGRTSVAVASR